MLGLAGLSEAEARAARIYALEERIARAQRTRADSRDVDKLYNLWTRADFAAKAPGLDWGAFLAAAGLEGQSLFLVGEPEAIGGAAAAAGEVGLQNWRDYLAFRAIRNFAATGPKAFRDEDFDFQGRTLSGTPTQPAAWKRAAQIVDNTMGQAVGGLYIEQYFGPQARAQARAMTDAIKLAMGARIARVDWMSVPTKQRALAKLAAVRVEVGSQEPLKDYSGLAIVRGQAFGDLLSAARFDYDTKLAKLGRPVDRGEWTMNPHLVNAQSNPTLVKVMIPAGILQPPFFDANADAAVNYGAIGVVMGHELSHQFDDQGAKFDEAGALVSWWAPEDIARFRAATDRLAAQYDAYQPLPGAHINGRLTLGENIADLGGLHIAFDAYRTSLGGRPAPVLGGLAGEQRFFMSFNQVYRCLQRESSLRQTLATDPHSPGEWRAAEVRNHDAWYASFDVRPGQREYLAPADRVRVW
jgi:putative endopeptidase